MITVIKRPLITEKASLLNERAQYAFEVDPRANKLQIKDAVEKLFDVNVVSVRTINIKSKTTARYTKKGMMRGTKGGMRKAYVSLKAGQTIDIVSGEGSEE